MPSSKVRVNRIYIAIETQGRITLDFRSHYHLPRTLFRDSELEISVEQRKADVKPKVKSGQIASVADVQARKERSIAWIVSSRLNEWDY